MPLDIDSTTFVSPNYNKLPDGRPLIITPQGILIHSDEGTRHSSLPLLCNPAPGGNPKRAVSCQYYVCRPINGVVDVYQLVSDNHRAWHAGASDYDGLLDWNLAIGIECEHKAGQDWPQAQLDALAELCRLKIARFHFPQSRIAAHRWVAVPKKRKIDPTNWPDVRLKPWIAALYATSYRAVAPMWVSETPTPYGPIALQGQATVTAGAILDIDESKNGWAHLRSGLGFVPIGGLERL
jgi:hypothetical protein